MRIIGVASINIGIFLLRSIVQWILASIKITNEIVISSIVFAVLFCSADGWYLLFVEKKQGKFLKPFWIKDNKKTS